MMELITMACKQGKVSAEEAVADYFANGGFSYVTLQEGCRLPYFDIDGS